MKIIADEQIPYIDHFFSQQHTLKKLPAEKINTDSIKEADALFIRSHTVVNKTLLAKSSVQFIGSATAGVDHMDTHFLDEAAIIWRHAPGCNANAVANYVLLSIAQLKETHIINQTHLRAGIIGVGQVGRQVLNGLQRIGCDVILNDPPRADQEAGFSSISLDEFHSLDLICLHTPLTITGSHPSWHLINKKFLSKLKKDCILLNAGRGACIDSIALKQHQFTVIFDVWEKEPYVDVQLSQSAFIATPHIAGYSQIAKYEITKALFIAFSQFFRKQTKTLEIEIPQYVPINLESPDWPEQMLKIENLKTLSDEFKKAIKKNPQNTSHIFKEFRKQYVFRKEFCY